MAAIRDINLLSRDLYVDIKQEEGFSFQLEKKGLFMLCQTHKKMEGEEQVIKEAQRLGLECKMMDAPEIKKMMPDAKMSIVGGSFYECDYHTTPHEFMEEMKTLLKSRGVIILTNEKVLDFEVNSGKITSVKTEKKEALKADEFILAAGAWTPFVAKKLGIRILLQAGKGYRINTTQKTGITYPSILMET